MNQNLERARDAIEHARLAYHQNKLQETRSWALRAIKLAPEIEDGWLWLAAVSSTDASIYYLEQVLKVNPGSLKARKGMHWAINRKRHSLKGEVFVTGKPKQNQPIAGINSQISLTASQPIIQVPIPSTNLIIERQVYQTLTPWIVLSIILLFLLWVFFSNSPLSIATKLGNTHEPVPIAYGLIDKATRTPTSTQTPTQTPNY